ncbi:MAG: 4Fe-4S dicluster domain-containing protein [Bacillota bacterium]
MPRLSGKFDKCTGCKRCLLACSQGLTGDIFNPRLARMCIQDLGAGLAHRPVVCAQCENAFCAASCPVDAIENSDGVWVIDQDRCTGCGLCLDACPLRVIVIHDGRAVKCDLCGGAPRCMDACAFSALELA